MLVIEIVQGIINDESIELRRELMLCKEEIDQTF